jgi:hypothetical protein
MNLTTLKPRLDKSLAKSAPSPDDAPVISAQLLPFTKPE